MTANRWILTVIQGSLASLVIGCSAGTGPVVEKPVRPAAIPSTGNAEKTTEPKAKLPEPAKKEVPLPKAEPEKKPEFKTGEREI